MISYLFYSLLNKTLDFFLFEFIFTPLVSYKIDIDMEKKYNVPISEAEKNKFYETVFKEHKVAIISSDYVCEIKLETTNKFWMRKNISRKFYNMEIAIYQVHNFLIVFLARSETPILLKKFDHPIELSADEGHDFIIKHISDKGETYEKYQWLERKQEYAAINYGDVVPDGYTPLPQRGSDHQWQRVYYRSNPELKSIDNTIFYDFVAKYWE